MPVHRDGAATYDAAKRLLALGPYDSAGHRRPAARLQRPQPGQAERRRPSGHGDHHHHRLRRAADRARGGSLRRRSSSASRSSPRSFSQRVAACLSTGAPPAPLAAQARHRRLPGDGARPPGRGRRRLLRRPAARDLQRSTKLLRRSTSRSAASACTSRSSRSGPFRSADGQRWSAARRWPPTPRPPPAPGARSSIGCRREGQP